MIEFLYPRLLWLGLGAAILLLWLTRQSFVADDSRYDDAKSIKRRSKLRWTVFVFRLLCVLLLIVAIATPLIRQSIIKEGDLYITVLVDNSSSMEQLDTSFLPDLIETLRENTPVTVKTIASGDSSLLGDSLLAAIKPNENVLLVTDGYTTGGARLDEVASFARQNNATISALNLKSKGYDAAVAISASTKTIADTNTTITVTVSANEEKKTHLVVTIDGEKIFDENALGDITITKPFSQGKHQIVAEILDKDDNPANDKYYTLLSVVEKPAVLLVTQRPTSMEPLLKQLYTVTTASSLPDDFLPYYAVVFADLPISSINSKTTALTNYLLDGNGLFVVGGPHSYDYGSYKSSALESLLPVTVGKGKSQQGLTSIVVALDMSGSVGGSYVLEGPENNKKLVYKADDKPALVRSLGMSVIDDISPNNNVGAVVIGSSSTNASLNLRGEGDLIFWDYVGGRTIGRVSPLGLKKDQLLGAVSTVQGGGQAASQYWVTSAAKAFEGVSGSKNIIIITDGQSCSQNCQASAGGSDEASTIALAKTIAAQGGKIYTVGVTSGNEDFLYNLAQTGNGIFFPATDKNKLRILFGDPSKTTGPDAYNIVILNSNHFITSGVSVPATMYGFNEVIPKPYSSLLATTGTGQPALTVWNYGVGRVASLTVYNGDDYGELVAKPSSLLLSRTGNWLVGDPERKQDYVVATDESYIGVESRILVKSSKIPVNDELTFKPIGDNTYQAEYTPASTGFGIIGGIGFAANYLPEYSHVGMNPQLETVTELANGRMLEPKAQDVLDHVKTIRMLQENNKRPFRTPLLIAAAIIFLLEIAARRIYEFRKKQ